MKGAINMNILVLIPAREHHKKELEKLAFGHEIVYSSIESVSDEMLSKADIIIGNPPSCRAQHFQNAKLIQLASAGTDGFTDGRLNKDTILTNCTGAYGLAMSEHMLAVTLQLMKNLNKYQDNQRHHVWQNMGATKGIAGSTALIIGLGDIGEEYAKRIKALGGYTIGVRRSSCKGAPFIDEMYTTDKLDTLLPRADIVALSLPRTALTHHIIDRERLNLMKSDAIIINVGRGDAIDIPALCDVMESGHLLGAGLDVTDPEPLGENDRLWDIPNVLITPHVSGGYQLYETFERVASICFKNLDSFLNGGTLLNVVDMSTKYVKPETKAHFDKLIGK